MSAALKVMSAALKVIAVLAGGVAVSWLMFVAAFGHGVLSGTIRVVGNCQ